MPQMKSKVHVIRDTREQKTGNGWWFPESSLCAGTVVQTLKSGDYTLEGFEETFVIERKSGTAEIAQNINEGRFVRELERLEEFRFPFLLVIMTARRRQPSPTTTTHSTHHHHRCGGSGGTGGDCSVGGGFRTILDFSNA